MERTTSLAPVGLTLFIAGAIAQVADAVTWKVMTVGVLGQELNPIVLTMQEWFSFPELAKVVLVAIGGAFYLLGLLYWRVHSRMTVLVASLLVSSALLAAGLIGAASNLATIRAGI